MLFGESDKLLLKFVWKYKGPRVAKTVLKKKNKVGCKYRHTDSTPEWLTFVVSNFKGPE